VSDEVYEQVRPEFTEEELELLTAAVAAINCWNRLNISFRRVPGDYHPPAHKPEGRQAAAPAHRVPGIVVREPEEARLCARR
jgi:hypothetical protein